MQNIRIKVCIINTITGDVLLDRAFHKLPVTIGGSKDCDIVVPAMSDVVEKKITFSLQAGTLFVSSQNSKNNILFDGAYYSSIDVDRYKSFSIGGLSFFVEFSKDEDATTTNFHPKNKSGKKSMFTSEVTQTINTEITEVKTVSDDRINEIIAKNKGFEALKNFQQLGSVTKVHKLKRVVHGFVTWHGEVLDSRLFFDGEPIMVGPGGEGLYLPFFHEDKIVGLLDRGSANISIPLGSKGELDLRSKDVQENMNNLRASGAIRRKGQHDMIKIKPNQVLEIDFNNNVSLFFFIDRPPERIYEKVLKTPEQMMKQALKSSGFVHGVFLILALVVAFRTPTTKIKDMPPRVAKLLVPKPEKKPEPPKPEKKPEPKKEQKIAKKETPKKPPKKRVVKQKIVQRVPKKVVVKKHKTVKVSSNVKVSKEVPRGKASPKEINNVGALAALGALSMNAPNPTNKPVALNVNPNAGGATTKVKTSGVIGALKSDSGRLVAGGSVGVKTKGQGYGSGTGFGVAGLQGAAGQRGSVRGVVVGTPTLMKVNKQEGLTRKQVMDIVKQHLDKVQRCYERALLSNPSLAGRAEYEWLISPKGSVVWAKVKSSDVQNGSELNGCVTKIFKGMKFPVAKNGETTQPSIGLPFGRM